MKRKLKIKWSNIIITFIFIICIITFCISGYNIIKWFIDRHNNNQIVEEINDIVTITETEDNSSTEIIEQKEEIEKSNPYWDYIKMDLINVDISKLKETNSQTKGWIKVNGTNINYPFVQAKDNEYYLTHSFDKKYNSAGWVFLDYRNTLKDDDKNTILYAHGRYDKTMFGSLKNILKSNWYKNKDNHVIKLSTEEENTLWQVFSVYHIKTTSDYIQTEFSSDEEYQALLDKLINRSAYKFNTTVSSKDKILTLSTCYNEKERVVMHAKLIKKEIR